MGTSPELWVLFRAASAAAGDYCGVVAVLGWWGTVLRDTQRRAVMLWVVINPEKGGCFNQFPVVFR